MSNLDTQLARYRAGEIDFDAFARATRSEFRRMAAYLLRRWPAPTWFTAEDVTQELYAGAWEVVPKHDPSRGVALSRFVVFGAMCRAKRSIHKSRGVSISGSPDKRESRFDVPLAALVQTEHAEEEVLAIASTSCAGTGAEDQLVEYEERVSAAKRAAEGGSSRDRVAVLAVARGGHIDAGADILYDDVDSRIALRLGSREAARRYVRDAAVRVARAVRSVA